MYIKIFIDHTNACRVLEELLVPQTKNLLIENPVDKDYRITK